MDGRYRPSAISFPIRGNYLLRSRSQPRTSRLRASAIMSEDTMTSITENMKAQNSTIMP